MPFQQIPDFCRTSMDELCPELDDGIAVRISSGKNSSAYAISSLENHDSQARSCQHCGCGKSSHPRAYNDYVRVKVHNFAPNKGWVQAWMTFLERSGNRFAGDYSGK